MAEIIDSFQYSIARQKFTGYVVTGISGTGSYTGLEVTPDEYIIFLSTLNSAIYPIKIRELMSINLNSVSTEDIFPPSGEYAELFEAPIFSSRKPCDICKLKTDQLYRVVYDYSSTGVIKQIRSSKADETINLTHPADKNNNDSYKISNSPSELTHCHPCFEDIHNATSNYLQTEGNQRIVSQSI